MRRRQFTALLAATAFAATRAQAQARTFRIGFLMLDAGETPALLTDRLAELGYAKGRNLAIDSRSAEGDPVRLPALAEELVRLKPDVLVAGWGTLAPKVLKAATATIPIVFTTVGDPLGAGLVQSLARPGGNVTGMSGQSIEFKAKQLQILLMAVPGQKTVGALYNPDTPYGALAMKELQAAADAQGVSLAVLEARQLPDYAPARMDTLVARGASSLMIIEDPTVSANRDRIVAETIRLKLPTMTGLAQFADAGSLLMYGASTADRYRQAAAYVDKILKGAKPGDLPVQQPTKFELTINQKTAKAIGVSLAPAFVAQADRVIE